MFTGIKDSLSSKAAKTLLAARVDRYGKLVDLRIRSRERTISAEVHLTGEEVPVFVEVERYRIEGNDGEPRLVIERVAASRVWLKIC